MKVIYSYQCEICEKKYNTPEQAIECEERGMFDLTKYPVGLLSYHKWREDFYGVFANVCSEVYSNPHLFSPSFVAYKSNENFEEDINIEEFQKCSSGNLISNENAVNFHGIDKTTLELRETKWLIKQLKANGIKSCYYNEQKELVYL